jgi:hypothetical protein
MDSFEQCTNLIECQSRNQIAGEIDMDLIGAKRRIRADPLYPIQPDPGQRIASKASLALLQSPPRTFMVSWGLLARTIKASQSMESLKAESIESIELL